MIVQGEWTPAAVDVEQPHKILEGKWKLVFPFHLYGGILLRFSELEKAIPGAT